jgi:hypothetical protein
VCGREHACSRGSRVYSNYLVVWSNALVQRVLPTDPNAGYSHMDFEETGYDLADIKAVRFYYHTSTHDRKMHFSTTKGKVKEIASTGSQVGNDVDAWTISLRLTGTTRFFRR